MENKYSKEFGVRFSWTQKSKFLKEIEKDLKELGYESSIHSKRIRFSKVRNLIAGNLKSAKKIVIVPYDTPSLILWPNYKYYPLEGDYFIRKHFAPAFLPMIVAYFILLAMIYIFPQFLNDFAQVVLFLMAVAYLVVLLIFIIRGFACPHNRNRNDASIKMALDFIQAMDAKTKKEIAFVFMDHASMKGYGSQVFGEYLEELHKNPKKIVLNCVGRGEEIAIGFSKGMRKDAIELSRRCKEYNIKTKSMSELDLMHTPAHALSDVLYISCGKFEEEHFVVYDTAGFKDKKIDEKRCEEVKNIVQTYIQM